MKFIGIYPGTSQPPTKSQYNAYKLLKKIVGVDTFVSTTDKIPTLDAPLNYGDKQQIWVRHGVPVSHIINVKNWKSPIEIFNNFSQKHTKVLFALNNKEVNELSKIKTTRQSNINDLKKVQPDEGDPDLVNFKNIADAEVWLDDKNNPSYFQPYKGNENSMKSLSEHGYVMVIDDSKIDGQPISTSNIRDVLGSDKYDPNKKKKFFRYIFGWFDVGLYTMISLKFSQAYSGSNEDPNDSNAVNENIRNKIQKLVYEVLDELMNTGNSSTTSTGNNITIPTDAVQKTPAEQRSDDAKTRQSLIKQKKELDAKAKQNKQQADQYKTTAKNYDTFQKKSDRDAINAVNKQISKS